jgi:[ribosomal protein S5]-alanine N-acetyltransferase
MAALPTALETGDRIFIRAPVARDRDELLELTRASTRLHRPWLAAPATPEAFTAWLRRSRSERAASFLVCLRASGAIVGVFNLSEIVRGSFQSAYTGYWAHAAHAGKGYMGEGLDLLLRHAFRTLRLHRLEANIQPGNEPSIALVRRAGFRLEGLSPRYLKIGGRWRDHERWAITVEDWKPRPGRGARRPR